MLQKKTFFPLVFGAGCAALFTLAGCKATVPKLDPMVSKPQVQTTYTEALRDLNRLLEAYLPPNYPVQYFVIKKAYDSTGLSGTGEIPGDITALVRDAVAQVHHKIRHLETYDVEDNTNLAVQMLLDQSGVHQGQYRKPAIRQSPDYTIQGTISQFDRNLESTGHKLRAKAQVGGGKSQTDSSDSTGNASELSRLAVSFSVYNKEGVSLPGKFGASMEVQYATNGYDLSIAIYGNSLGYATEAQASHGRHLALQMMSEFSVVQIIGRILEVPYWRVGADKQIYTPDAIVLSGWRESYDGMGRSGQLIGYMQSQCVANGDSSVSPTGQLDAATQASFERFAEQYGVQNRNYPNFELFRALEENRVLNHATAAAAWAAWDAFTASRAGVAQSAAQAPEATAASAQPAAKPAARPARRGSKPRAARPTNPSGGYKDPAAALQDLL